MKVTGFLLCSQSNSSISNIYVFRSRAFNMTYNVTKPLLGFEYSEGIHLKGPRGGGGVVGVGDGLEKCIMGNGVSSYSSVLYSE